MAKGKEKSNQDEEKVATASEVLASAAASLTTSAAALTTAATGLTSAADALTAYASPADKKDKQLPTGLDILASAAGFASDDDDSDGDQADLECGNNPMEEGVFKLFREFKARRNGIVKALTTDVNNFHRLCDPKSDDLCLHGDTDASWTVMFSKKYVPLNIPEPTRGINFIRDQMNRNEWLVCVAMHSDAWLYRTVFFSRHNLEDKSRRKLFRMINKLPTIRKVVKEAVNKPLHESTSEKSSKRNNSSSHQLMPAPKRAHRSG